MSSHNPAVDPACAFVNMVIGEERRKPDLYRLRNNGWGAPWQTVWHKLRFAAELVVIPSPPLKQVPTILFQPDAIALLERKCLNAYWLWEVLFRAKIHGIPVPAVPLALAIQSIRTGQLERHGVRLELNALARELAKRASGRQPGASSLSPETLTYLFQHGFILRTHPDRTGKFIINPIFRTDD